MSAIASELVMTPEEAEKELRELDAVMAKLRAARKRVQANEASYISQFLHHRKPAGRKRRSDPTKKDR